MMDIACIIVTFNRIHLLQECIEAVRRQTYKDFDIIVINNGSSDGTKEWLDEQPDIMAINQENVGGAGGFYTGMKVAFEKGYEWIWMMDDDGLADSHQLENLLHGSEKCHSKFVNSLVCNINNPSKLAFGLVNNAVGITELEEAQTSDFILDSINPFNGTFIHRDVISSIGLIKKEMFIWGDEMEYTYRARKAGFSQFTITSALHYHPTIKSQQVNIFPFVNRYKVDVPANKKRAYIKYRNNGYICHNYFPEREFVEKLKYSLYFVIHFKFSDLFLFFKYYNKGKKDIFEQITI